MNEWLGSIYLERWKLLEATAAHVDLVGESLLIAVILGVPLGILASHARLAERIIIGLANVMQTIPSLALLGVLLILYGGQIGKAPARTALVIYSLLPIIKNTILGLKGVDRGVLEAAVGMGMTLWQRLVLVELPLAVPVLLGGVRLASVSAVGMATIATAIGAKGLGSFIYGGIETSNPTLIFLGSLAAASLALAFDGVLGELERRLDPTRHRRFGVRDVLVIAATVVLLGLGLAGFWSEVRSAGGKATIVIGSKDSAEPKVLGHMLADLVEAHTALRVDRRLDLGGSLVAYNALKRGGLDLYVEYTGTALTTFLKQPPAYDPSQVRRTVGDLMAKEGITVLEPLGFENTFAILMRGGQAEALEIQQISDLTSHLSTLRIGFGPEFGRRPDGFPGLARAYGLTFDQPPVEMNRNLLYQALAKGSIDVAAGDSTDGRVATLDLVQLEDDRRFFPPYEAVPLVRAETLKRHPTLKAALDRLAGRIDAKTMRRLNNEVDGKKRDPGVVAREFLDQAGLLRP